VRLERLVKGEKPGGPPPRRTRSRPAQARPFPPLRPSQCVDATIPEVARQPLGASWNQGFPAMCATPSVSGLPPLSNSTGPGNCDPGAPMSLLLFGKIGLYGNPRPHRSPATRPHRFAMMPTGGTGGRRGNVRRGRESRDSFPAMSRESGGVAGSGGPGGTGTKVAFWVAMMSWSPRVRGVL